jgi:hypothetical protein
MGTEPWFVKIELELTTGRTFHSALTREETMELAKGFIVQEELRDADLALVRAAFNTIAWRAEKREGGLVLPDAQGRSWLFAASAIAAFGFEHRLDLPGKKRAIEFGFRRPEPPSG